MLAAECTPSAPQLGGSGTARLRLAMRRVHDRPKRNTSGKRDVANIGIVGLGTQVARLNTRVGFSSPFSISPRAMIRPFTVA